MIKTVLSRIAIFGAGIGLGWLITKKYYENLIDEEIASIREHLRSYDPFDDGGESGGNGMTEEEDEEFETAKEITRTAPNPLNRSSLDRNPYEQMKKNYNLVGKRAEMGAVDEHAGYPVATSDDEEEEPDDEDTDAAGMTEEEINPAIDRTQPYVIDCDAFSNEFDHHDKVNLYYYRTDDVLCEETEEVVTDVDGTIGYDALSVLDTQTTVWVRNEPLGIDYEIIGVSKSFAEAVGGTPRTGNLSPREQYIQRQKAKQGRGET